MQFIRKNIFIRDEKFVVFFGIKTKGTPKGPSISLYLCSGRPGDKMSTSDFIKGGFASKQEALRYGVSFVKETYHR
ncbi:hypothetical protein E0494_01465 [Marinilabiliaceae bacterium JC040]|nr:hypothetical protein [Marinilabiliaceae bacterium JC040]